MNKKIKYFINYSIILTSMIYLIIIFSSCDSVAINDEGLIKVNFNIIFPNSEGKNTSLSNINSIHLRVTGDGINDVIEIDFEYNHDENFFFTNLNVPAGIKQFELSAYYIREPDHIMLFEGYVEENIQSNGQQVNIDLVPPHYENNNREFYSNFPDNSSEPIDISYIGGLDGNKALLFIDYNVDEHGPLLITEIEVFTGEANGPIKTIILDGNRDMLNIMSHESSQSGWQNFEIIWPDIWNDHINHTITGPFYAGIEFAGINDARIAKISSQNQYPIRCWSENGGTWEELGESESFAIKIIARSRGGINKFYLNETGKLIKLSK